MRGELVAVDLETTGLDSARDEIIEIGAVRTRDGEILDEFTTLINPGRTIPAPITHLTGIRGEDVLDAPGIQTVLPQLSAFVGNAALLGHNITFDASFLYRHGILRSNARVDTYEMAAVLLPRAPRYSLTSLSTIIGADIESAHRAVFDARATVRLYWLLWQKLLDLPYPTLREIAEAAQELAWDARAPIEAALRERAAENSADIQPTTTFFRADPVEHKPLRANDVREPVDPAEVAEMFSENGPFAQVMPGFEYRVQQVDMAAAVTGAFSNSQHALIEAGTGTGKSLAYLVPALLWSLRNNERVVISTNTINLQEQLVLKDIPGLGFVLKLPFNAALMKGRANYLCPRRLAAARRRRPNSVDEVRTLAKVLVWLLESDSGDRSEITLRGSEENLTWQRLSADDEGCTLDRCKHMMGGTCPFYKARKAAEAAHLLVVNHALLISDAASENRVLPEYSYLILDEAHNFEDAVTNGLSFRVDEPALRRRLADLGGPKRGLLAHLLNSVQVAAPDKEMRRFGVYVEGIGDAVSAMEVHVRALFKAVRALAAGLTGSRSDFQPQARVTESVRANPAFRSVQAAWSTLKEFFEVVGDALHQLAVALTRLEGYQLEDYDDLVNATDAAARYLNEVHVQLNAVFAQPDPNGIYWLSLGQDADYVAINSAPLHIGPMMEKYIWHQKESAILTSATLQTNRSFDFLRGRLNAENVEALEVGSPFNYRESTLVYVPDDVPDPNDRMRYQQSVERGIIELAAALGGRVLVLFTSYTQLRQTAQAITPRLALGDITVYDQSDGSSRQTLLDGFRTTEKAVLLGTRSFWEGVDIPGDALSGLVIARLPFSVPTDPIFAARSETYTDSFNQYTLPDAVLRFRQGFGRLIRTRTDRGVVAVLDSRVLTKSYGSTFIQALPECRVLYGPLGELPSAAVHWLNPT
jgi:ATP-dependent DNA helicase DinG